MVRLLSRIDDTIAAVENALIWVCFAVVALVLFTAVIFRYVFNAPFTWTEELVTILFTWMVFLGASSCFRAHLHLRVEAFVRLLPRMAQIVLALGAIAVMAVMLSVFIWHGLVYAFTVMDDRTPMLDISFSYAFFALPVTSAFAMVHILRVAIVEGIDRTFMSITEIGDDATPEARS